MFQNWQRDSKLLKTSKYFKITSKHFKTGKEIVYYLKSRNVSRQTKRE